MNSPRVGQIFQAALDRPEAERAAYLDGACAGDSELRAQVEKLLAALEEAGSFFAEPKSEEAGERAGAMIDRYKLLQEIGEGGMGVVWMAEQQEPVRRKVALKVIKLGMDTRQVVARFEAERQALAMMDHPNIAKVLDGGATPQGRPYFVMELVKGVPLTEYCDQANLSATERLELFQQVCHAVQHAHQKGVIHRDLKPGNILVTHHDGVPMPKVIDFGIAKATSAELTQRTLFTEFREMIGTPEYMAPEQAEMSALDIDTRADVYSLGVVLYEVLTGTKPFEIAKVLEKGYAEMMRVIREDDPPKPSTRVSTLGESLASVAQRRHTTPAALGKLMRGDLDWIVMRALDKDRSRRYATASDLAADIGRHLSHEPVHAGPPSASYRLRKYMRRNRVTVIAGAMVFGALLTGLGAATWGFLEAIDQRDRAVFAEKEAGLERDAADDARELAVAEKERADGEADNARKSAKLATAEAARATKEANRANTVLDLVNEMLGSANPERLKGPNYTVRQVLADFERGLGDRLKDQPEVEVSLRELIAGSYAALGVYATADDNYVRALAILEAMPDPDPHQRALLLSGRSAISGSVVRFADAEAQAGRALEVELACESPDLAFCAELRASRARALAYLGRYDEAEQLARRALSEMQSRPGAEPFDASEGWSLLSQVAAKMRNYEEAKSAARRALDLTVAKHGAEHPHTAHQWAVLANALVYSGSIDEAVEAYEVCLEIDRNLIGDQHPNVGIALMNIGDARMRQGRPKDAIAQFLEALELLRESLGDHHYTHRTLTMLAGCYASLGQFEEATARARESLAIQERVGATPFLIGANHRVLADAGRGLGRLDQAEESARRAIAGMQSDPNAAALRGADRRSYVSNLATLRADLAITLKLRGQLGSAVQLFRDTLGYLRAEGLEDARRYYDVCGSLAETLIIQAERAEAQKKSEEAIAKRREANEILRDTIAALQRLQPEGDPNVAWVLVLSARNLEPGVPERERLYRRALEILDAADCQHLPAYGQALFGLADELRTQARPAEAVSVYRRALELARGRVGDDHDETLALLVKLGRTSLVARDYAQCEVALREFVERRQKAGQPVFVVDWVCLTTAYTKQLNSRQENTPEQQEESLRLHRMTIQAGKRDWPDGHRMAGVWEFSYAGSLFNLNRIAEAVPAYRDALRRTPKARQQGTAFASKLASFALCLLLTEQFAEAEVMARRCHDIRVAAIPDSWLRYNAMSLVGGALLGQGKLEAAEPLLLEGFEKMEPPANSRNRLIQAHERIVKLYEKWGREEEAAKWRKKAPEAQKK